MTETKAIKGSCLCGAVGYEFNNPIGIFQYCHCERCRKFTGSAHAANLFVKPENFTWTQGEDSVGHYQLKDTKYFATAFCKHCGSSMPWTIQTGQTIVVPAGGLDDDPGIRPTQNIFCAYDAHWYIPAEALKKFDELPTK